MEINFLENTTEFDSSSMDSSTSWGSQELDWQRLQSKLLSADRAGRAKAASYADLVSGRCKVNDAMQEFRLNGSDAPYDPDDADCWRNSNELPSGGPAAAYRRQQSWPAASRPRPVRPQPIYGVAPTVNIATLSANDMPTAANFMPKSANVITAQPGGSAMMPNQSAHVSIPVKNNRIEDMVVSPQPSPPSPPGSLTAEQRRVLNSLPDALVVTLLRDMQRSRRQAEECRFCKNNGERESYYRSHCLKDVHGRVQCPVLRAFVCKRCGARGDNAHTIKYCPMSTNEERIQSANMMRSMRMASGRRRVSSGGGAVNYVVFGETPTSVLSDQQAYTAYSETAPALDPLWIALEQKLLLS